MSVPNLKRIALFVRKLLGVPNVAPPQTPFPGRRTAKILSAGDGHYLHLQTQFDEDRCTQTRVIMVTDTARPPATNTHTETGPYTLRRQLARSVNNVKSKQPTTCKVTCLHIDIGTNQLDLTTSLAEIINRQIKTTLLIGINNSTNPLFTLWCSAWHWIIHSATTEWAGAFNKKHVFSQLRFSQRHNSINNKCHHLLYRMTDNQATETKRTRLTARSWRRQARIPLVLLTTTVSKMLHRDNR